MSKKNFELEDEAHYVARNVGNRLHTDTASHPITTECSVTPPPKFKNFEVLYYSKESRNS
jgi:hypothetical protein